MKEKIKSIQCLNYQTCLEAFQTIKVVFIIEPILSYLGFNKLFNVTWNAGNFTIGSVISHDSIGKIVLFIYQSYMYSSRILNKVEQNYFTTEKKILTIVWSLKQLLTVKIYLLGRK